MFLKRQLRPVSTRGAQGHRTLSFSLGWDPVGISRAQGNCCEQLSPPPTARAGVAELEVSKSKSQAGQPQLQPYQPCTFGRGFHPCDLSFYIHKTGSFQNLPQRGVVGRREEHACPRHSAGQGGRSLTPALVVTPTSESPRPEDLSGVFMHHVCLHGDGAVTPVHGQMQLTLGAPGCLSEHRRPSPSQHRDTRLSAGGALAQLYFRADSNVPPDWGTFHLGESNQ